MGEGKDPTEQLQESRNLSFETFDRRVREEAEFVKEHLADGTFDNKQVTVGLECEFYAVDRETESDAFPGDCWAVSGSRKNSSCTTANWPLVSTPATGRD